MRRPRTSDSNTQPGSGTRSTSSSESSERSPRQVDENGRTSPRLSAGYVLVLLAVPAWAFLGVAANNVVGLPHVERLVAACFIAWALMWLVVWFGVKQGLASRPMVMAVFLGTLAILSTRGIADRFGTLATLALTVGVAASAFWLVNRMSASNLPDVLLVGLAVALVAAPVMDLYRSVADRGASTLFAETPVDVDIVDALDIYLVVLDGHPGLRALELDYGPDVVESIEGELGAAGYQLPDSAWASYRATDYSIPSLLNMSYPTDTTTGTPAETQELYEIIAGDNAVHRILDSEGYLTHMLESGWSGSSCREYENCVASPLLDESMFIPIEQSALGWAVLERYGYAFTAGATSAMAWLEANVSALGSDQTPDFVFAHIMAPHPPFFLDRECEMVVTDERSGVRFARSGVPSDRRSDLLVDQVDCLQDFLVKLAANVSDEGIVVVVSDHGSDRRNQLSKDPSEWTESEIVERMNAYVAVKAPDGCDVGDEIVLPNVMRRVLTCLSAAPVPDVPSRIFLGDDFELPLDEVADLVRGGAISG